LLPDATVIRHALAAGGLEPAEIEETPLGLVCWVPPADVVEALAALKASDLGFVMLVDLLGTDTAEEIEITYHLRSFARDEELYIKTRLPYESALVSVWESYPAALLPERETAEMFGLTLAGHPNPKRLLTTEGLPALLLKSTSVRDVHEMRDR
jgi:NADH:ubiquinone oxidoreductase subunit C